MSQNDEVFLCLPFDIHNFGEKDIEIAEKWLKSLDKDILEGLARSLNIKVVPNRIILIGDIIDKLMNS